VAIAMAACGNTAGSDSDGSATTAVTEEARTGRGYTETEVFIGVGSQDNNRAVTEAIGQDLVFGNIREETEALLADINARGGILGREVVAVFHDDDATNTSFEVRGQAACTTWVEDNGVAAVANAVAAIALDTTLECLKDNDTPMFTSVLTSADDGTYEKYAPYLITPGVMSFTRIVDIWVERLAAQGYFEPNAVYGILLPDIPEGERTAQRLTAELARRDITVKTTVKTSVTLEGAQADNSAAVLRFAADGVTHLFVLDSSSAILFPPAAESQRFRPRYALTSFAALNIAQQTAPAEQWQRAAGIGFLPSSDVDAAHDPGDLGPNETRCRDLMTRAGIDISTREAEAVAQVMCDSIWLFERVATLGGGFSTAAVRRGLDALGNAFESTLTFRTQFGMGRFDGAAAVRDIAFDTDCRCFVYQPGEPHPA
jgi:hypothetical protein